MAVRCYVALVDPVRASRLQICPAPAWKVELVFCAQDMFISGLRGGPHLGCGPGSSATSAGMFSVPTSEVRGCARSSAQAGCAFKNGKEKHVFLATGIPRPRVPSPSPAPRTPATALAPHLRLNFSRTAPFKPSWTQEWPLRKSSSRARCPSICGAQPRPKLKCKSVIFQKKTRLFCFKKP